MGRTAEITTVEVRRYQQAGAHIGQAHPELVGGGPAAEMTNAGFDWHPRVTEEIIKRAKPEITAWLLTQEGRGDAHALNNVKDNEERSLAELERIAGRVERQGAFRKPVEKHDEVADYLEQRRQELKEGRRRR